MPVEMFDMLANTVAKKPGSTLLEFGSGPATLELRKIFSYVISIEDNEEYYEKLKPFDEPGKIVVHAPLLYGWYDRRKVENYLTYNHYDACVVDGPVGPNRPNIKNNLDLLHRNVPILFDATNRESDKATALYVAYAFNMDWEEYQAGNKSFIALTPKI